MADLEATIAELVGKIGKYIDDAGTLTVQTWGMDISATPATTFDKARAIAQSELKFDGDTTVILPVRADGANIVVDTALFDLHSRNVQAATDYRAQLLTAFMGAVGSLSHTKG